MRKMALVVPEGLELSEGKLAAKTAQAAAASSASNAVETVVLEGGDEQLDSALGKIEDVEVKRIRDAGRTEVAAGSHCVTVFYGDKDKVERATSHFSLL